MIIKKIFPVALLFLFVSLLPILRADQDGAYNTISRTILCKNKAACIHEIAHKLDQESGWISRSDEFSLAVRAYMIFEMQTENPSTLVYNIFYTPGLFTWKGMFFNHQAEIYAEIFEYVDGEEENMPERLREFYDWERAEELIERYVR